LHDACSSTLAGGAVSAACRSRAVIPSTARAMCGSSRSTAVATVASSAFIVRTISRALIRSIALVAGFRFSVSSGGMAHRSRRLAPASYTHLTLPTIYSL